MTVCIAAACDFSSDGEEKAIVLCSDWRVSGALGSADTMLKLRHLTGKWRLLTSGFENDINAIVKAFRHAFHTASELDDVIVPGIVREVLMARKREKSDEFCRGKYSISYDDFFSFGKEKLPPDIFREAIVSISEITVGCSCIIAGFDSSGHQFIVETTDNCRVLIRDDFASIGEGAYLAQASLLQRGHISTRRLAETIYTVYEAKRYAEHVISVGTITSLEVVTPKRSRVIPIQKTKELHPYFEKYGPQKIDISVVSKALAVC